MKGISAFFFFLIRKERIYYPYIEIDGKIHKVQLFISPRPAEPMGIHR